jgi:hypothetical protein
MRTRAARHFTASLQVICRQVLQHRMGGMTWLLSGSARHVLKPPARRPCVTTHAMEAVHRTLSVMSAFVRIEQCGTRASWASRFPTMHVRGSCAMQSRVATGWTAHAAGGRAALPRCGCRLRLLQQLLQQLLQRLLQRLLQCLLQCLLQRLFQRLDGTQLSANSRNGPWKWAVIMSAQYEHPCLALQVGKMYCLRFQSRNYRPCEVF